MRDDLASSITLWLDSVDHLPGYDEEVEVSTALVWRDEIAYAIAAGRVVSQRDIEAISNADRRYAALRSLLREWFPELYDRRAPHSFWWWHVDQPVVPPATPIPAADLPPFLQPAVG